MLRLFVMRHAKSSWALPGARDFDRELNERGRSDLETISNLLKNSAYHPELILCSSAQRTRQTLDGILKALQPDPVVDYRDDLYSGGMNEYLEIINGIEGPKSVMIIGHNPMCGTLANTMSGSGGTNLIDRISMRYPTSTVAVIDFDSDSWMEARPGSGRLVDCLYPVE